MPDNHFLQEGLLSLSVSSLITFFCLLFSVLLNSLFLFNFITSVFHWFSPWASQSIFVYHYLHNQYVALLPFLVSHQAVRVVNPSKADQYQMLPPQNSYIPICTGLKKKFKETRGMNKREIHNVADPICIHNSIIRIILGCLLF